MVDYNEAFKQGLEAAMAAGRAKKEIDSVFDDLNRQIDKIANGMIRIGREEITTTVEDPGHLVWGMYPHTAVKKKWAIVAYNPSASESPRMELASWKQDRAGYPCRIKWDQAEHICEDKEALENTLAELLRDPLVGEKLNTLMKLEETASEQ